MFKWLWLIPIAPTGRDRTVNEPQNNWQLALAMLIAAFAYAGLVALIIYSNLNGRHILLGQVIAIIGVSLVAAVWYGHIGIKNSSIRFKRIRWHENLVFVLAILGTISGFAWLLLGLATLDLSGSSSAIWMLIGVLAMLGLLWGALALLAGLISCVVFRGYFLYFFAQLVFIATGCYCIRIVSSV